jgi:two-component system NtrC family sensor kinase
VTFRPVRLPQFGLAAKLAAWLVAGVIVCFVLFSFAHQRLEQRHLESLVSLSAQRVADVVHFSAWQAMLRNDQEMLYTMIRDIGREPGIRRLRIINEVGLVRYSTAAGEIGTMVDKQAEACYACHAQAQPLTRLQRKDRTRIFRSEGGHRVLAVILPIENHPDCSTAACHAHPPGRRILGVIDAHLSLDAVDEQLAEHRVQMYAFTAGAAVIGCLMALVFVWFFVHRPVHDLVAGTMRLAAGDLGHRIQVHSRDELGALAESFNEMAEDLEKTHRELTEWADTLEERVREKTAELEAAQKSLIHTEKMASLGRLAATVAHEVNNPLFGMLTYARLVLKDLQKPDLDEAARRRMEDNLRIIERESRRCGDLMKNLLAFARQSTPQRTRVQVNQVVERAMRLVAHQYELSQIALRTQLDESLPEIDCDPGQIQQVLIVLLVNAQEALGRGGEVAVETRRAGQSIEIVVRDNGPGIPKDLQLQIFEPFFSTKDDPHRTGLGLAVAKGIVERHGGRIRLNSSPGRGAEFIVELPLEAPESEQEPETMLKGGA